MYFHCQQNLKVLGKAVFHTHISSVQAYTVTYKYCKFFEVSTTKHMLSDGDAIAELQLLHYTYSVGDVSLTTIQRVSVSNNLFHTSCNSFVINYTSFC